MTRTRTPLPAWLLVPTAIAAVLFSLPLVPLTLSRSAASREVRRSALGFTFAWNDGENLTTDQQTDLAVLERGLISHTVFDFGGTAPL